MHRVNKKRNESGSVTAELVLALPAVMLLVSVTIAAMGLQVERMKLVGAAAAIARSIARSESLETTETIHMNMSPNSIMELSEPEGLVCVELSLDAGLPGLSQEIMELKEIQCARATGL
jgi:hypothetical protein